MKGSPENTVWCACFTDELARAGVEEVVIAPGSRSTPLVMAFFADERFRKRVHLDERSASFFALGVGKATGKPAVVVTTSGTAVANLLPAVVEASRSGVPLLVLTADRPHRLRGADANQAIDQPGIYGAYPRAFFESSPPSLHAPALRHLRALAGRAYAAAVGPGGGPVHVNFPFDKPLEPAPAPEDLASGHPSAVAGRPDGEPFTRVASGTRSAGAQTLTELVRLIRVAASEGEGGAGGGVVVAGPNERAGELGAAVLRFAAAAGFPVLADPLSGARYRPPGGADVVAGYDLFLGDDAVCGALAPSLVVRVGATPTSAALQRWLLHHHGVEHLVIDDGVRWLDHLATATRYVDADPVDALDRLASVLEGEHDADADGPDERTPEDDAESAWASAWRVAEATALAELAEAVGGETHEGGVVGSIVAGLPRGTSLVVSSSMPIRDVDAFGLPRAETLHVFANRGASGIDGVVSTAFGVSAGSGSPTVCLIGDVAFFHDQNGLLWSREDDAPVVFVVIDNDGGGIFHRLPIADHDPAFTRFFTTPHGLSPEHAARMHGLRYEELEPEAVTEAIAVALSSGSSAVLRLRFDGARSHRLRAELEDRVRRRVGEAIAAGEGPG